jgi:hypothetical protein
VSAWIVSRTHIDLLIEAGQQMVRRRIGDAVMRWYVDGHGFHLDQQNRDQVGSMLWLENYAGVTQRYPHVDDLPGPYLEGLEVLGYSFTAVSGTLDPVVVLKAITCYEYQSREHEGWNTSPTRAFCAARRDHCVAALPGYVEAPWGFEDRAFFTRASPGAGRP